MAQLSTQIEEYLKANNYTNEINFKSDVRLQNDGGETYIKEWNIPNIEKPTLEQLSSYESVADSNTKWKNIREERNKLLAETDFYALSDVTMSTEMANYRQALRDLPSTQSDPDDIVFPTKP